MMLDITEKQIFEVIQLKYHETAGSVFRIHLVKTREPDPSAQGLVVSKDVEHYDLWMNEASLGELAVLDFS